MRFVLPVLIACLLLAACGGEPGQDAAGRSRDRAATAAETVANVAVLKTDLNLGACLEEESTEPEAAPNSCPSYVLRSLDFMTQECSQAGGTLQISQEPEAWLLDVDADGKREVLIDLAGNFICYGAPAVFSCGSLGCPYFLYAQRGDGWVELGAVSADDAPGIEVLTAPAGTPGTLRGGCIGQKPCSELTHYTWDETHYDRTWIDYRGHAVDVVPVGLATLVSDARVLAAPAKGAQALDEYPAGTAMAVIGTARAAPYSYVSPCNACPRGFVETAALKN